MYRAIEKARRSVGREAVTGGEASAPAGVSYIAYELLMKFVERDGIIYAMMR